MTNKTAEHKMPFRTESGLYGEQSWWAELSAAYIPLLAQVAVHSAAPPLRFASGRSAQFRSPLHLKILPLQWNRSTLAPI